MTPPTIDDIRETLISVRRHARMVLQEIATAREEVAVSREELAFERERIVLALGEARTKIRNVRSVLNQDRGTNWFLKG